MQRRQGGAHMHWRACSRARQSVCNRSGFHNKEQRSSDCDTQRGSVTACHAQDACTQQFKSQTSSFLLFWCLMESLHVDIWKILVTCCRKGLVQMHPPHAHPPPCLWLSHSCLFPTSPNTASCVMCALKTTTTTAFSSTGASAGATTASSSSSSSPWW